MHWQLMIHWNKLRERAGLSTTTLARLSKNEKVSLDALGKICETLDCNIGDIIDYISEDKHEKR